MRQSCHGKKCMEDGRAQYVRYIYDIQGNKLRQFIGMTEPLTLTVSEVMDIADDVYFFSYAGKLTVLISAERRSQIP